MRQKADAGFHSDSCPLDTHTDWPELLKRLSDLGCVSVTVKSARTHLESSHSLTKPA